jgi:hypothetical protein
VPAGAGGATGTTTSLSPLAAGVASVALAALAALAATGRRRVALVLAAALIQLPPPSGPPAHEAPPPALSVAQPPPAAPAPARLRIDSAGVDTALTGVPLSPGGVLVPPAGPAAAGWLTDGPAPGAPGPAVIAGHVDGPAGPAVFATLRNVGPGDPVLVTRADGSTVVFTVTRAVRYAKHAFPTREVYGPTVGAELRLITCGGDFDRARGSYRDNLVVYARAT